MLHNENVSDGAPLILVRSSRTNATPLLILIPLLILMNVVGYLSDGPSVVKIITTFGIVAIILMTFKIIRTNRLTDKTNRETSGLRLVNALCQEYGLILENGTEGDGVFLLNEKGDGVTDIFIMVKTIAMGKIIGIKLSLSEDGTELILTDTAGNVIPRYYGFEEL